MDRSEDVVIETNDVLKSLYDHFDKGFPDTARLYHEQISEENDVTIGEGSIVEDLLKLEELEGTIYCVVYTKFFLFGLTGILGTLLKILLLGLLSYLLRPKPPIERNTGDQSPNNGLSDRVNTGRPNERIPDIYGEVRSVPDLIAQPYFRFEANQEVEYTYLCVGRGEFRITDIKDDQTPIEDIAAVSVEVYGPFQSPNESPKTVQSSIGRAINERVWAAVKSNAVNGQILRAPDATLIEGDENIAFNGPDQIVTNDDDVNFESFFAVGDEITIANSQSGENSGNPLNLDGTFEIFQVYKDSIVLINPGLVNSDWDGIFSTDYSNANLSSDTDKWVGPFKVKSPWIVLANYIAQQGMYSDDGTEQSYIQVQIETEMTPINSLGQAIGPTETTQRYIEGSEVLQNSRSESSWYELTGNVDVDDAKDKEWEVRARRITPKFDEEDVRFVDEVQWRDLYSMEYVDQENFGDVTTIMVRTPATAGALSIKQRKLNCLAWRMIPGRIPDTFYEFTNYNVTTSDSSLIIRHIALDPTLGNMTEEELDYENMFTAIAINQQYFGTLDCKFFNYTFDERDLSAEEMISTVAEAAFFVPYRQGSLLKLKFEGKTALSSLLFNHRNKIPASEIRTVRFGTSDNHDGVEFDWVDKEDGATETYQIPYDGSASNPQKIEVPGIGNLVQAHMHAWRQWQKIQYQNVAVEFEGTAEAATLILNDRVLVADNTRGDTNDGNIIGQEGLTLELSQPFEPEPGESYAIFFQLFDGSVENLDILSINSPTSVTVGTPPSRPLVLDADRYARTTYQIIKDSRIRPNAFLIQEIDPKDQYVVGVSAVNYDDRYYDHDKDFIDGFFDELGEITFIFQETWEELDCPAGQWRHYQNPGQFNSTLPFEIQNNIIGVGPAAQGVKLGELDGTNRIWVTLDTNPAFDYDLIMFYSPRAGVSAAFNAIEVWWDGNLVTTLSTDGSDNETVAWESIAFQLPGTTGITAVLEFRSVADGGLGLGGLIDDIRVRQTELQPTFLRPDGVSRIFRPNGFSIYRRSLG